MQSLQNSLVMLDYQCVCYFFGSAGLQTVFVLKEKWGKAAKKQSVGLFCLWNSNLRKERKRKFTKKLGTAQETFCFSPTSFFFSSWDCVWIWRVRTFGGLYLSRWFHLSGRIGRSLEDCYTKSQTPKGPWYYGCTIPSHPIQRKVIIVQQIQTDPKHNVPYLGKVFSNAMYMYSPKGKL